MRPRTAGASNSRIGRTAGDKSRIEYGAGSASITTTTNESPVSRATRCCTSTSSTFVRIRRRNTCKNRCSADRSRCDSQMREQASREVVGVLAVHEVAAGHLLDGVVGSEHAACGGVVGRADEGVLVAGEGDGG